MAQLIHKFLWQGGKENEKKFHMVNWSTVCAPKENGGLGIRDPEKINIALGAKLLWRLVSDGNDWWKKEICYKYLTRNRKRCLDVAPTQQIGSPIWKLLSASLPLLRDHLFWCPGKWKRNQDLG
jgi:hypothetical protein